MSSGGITVACGTRPGVGLIEAIPQQCAGLRSEPPTSLPSPSGRHARGQRAGLAAAGAARGHVRVPRVAGQAAQRRVGVDAQPEVGQVRAADRDRARGAQALDLRRVDRRDRLGQRRHARTSSAVPATSMFSLTVNGTPCSGPRALGRRASAASAAARASSASTTHDRVEVRR